MPSNNRFPALMFHGGEGDVVAGSFKERTENLWAELDERGHLGIVCDHGRNHIIPTDAQPDVRRFLEAHPFGTVMHTFERKSREIPIKLKSKLAL